MTSSFSIPKNWVDPYELCWLMTLSRSTGNALPIVSNYKKHGEDSLRRCTLVRFRSGWTQLFPQAVGLVTDIGGILSHGSIVAREYGIPAVLGLGNATRRIADGQTITLDGTQGKVDISTLR